MSDIDPIYIEIAKVLRKEDSKAIIVSDRCSQNGAVRPIEHVPDRRSAFG